MTNVTKLLEALHAEWPTLAGAHHGITIRDEALQGMKLREPLVLTLAVGPNRSPRTFFMSDEDLTRPPGEIIETFYMLLKDEPRKPKKRGRSKRK